MMWHVLFYWYFKKDSVPSKGNGQRVIMHVIQRFDR